MRGAGNSPNSVTGDPRRWERYRMTCPSTASMITNARKHLVALLKTAIKAAQPALCLPPHLPPPPPSKGRLIVLGAGKAAAAMAQVTERHYADLGVQDRLVGVVTTRHGYELPTTLIKVTQASHPVPGDSSVQVCPRSRRMNRIVVSS